MSYTNWNNGIGLSWENTGSPQQPQLPPNVQVIKMDWRDILGAQGNSATSATSPFKIPMSMNSAIGAPQQQHYQQTPNFPSGVYTGTGIRHGHEQEGLPPATFRISVGNSGDFAEQSKSGDTPRNFNFPYPYIPPGQESAGGSPNCGDAATADMQENVAQNASKVFQFQACGNCDACKYKAKKPVLKGRKKIASRSQSTTSTTTSQKK